MVAEGASEELRSVLKSFMTLEPRRPMTTRAERAVVLYVSTLALASFLFWWPAPSGAVCWHAIFGSLSAVRGEEAEAFERAFLSMQRELFIANAGRGLQGVLRDTLEKAGKLKRDAVPRGEYLLKGQRSLPPNAGAERYVLQAVRRPQSDEMPLYSAKHGAWAVSLTPAASGPSGPAGISRGEAVAGMQAFSKASKGLVEVERRRAAPTLSDLQRVIAAATWKSAEGGIAALRKSTARRLAPFLAASFCTGQTPSFPLSPVVDLKYLAACPLARILKNEGMEEPVDKGALKDFFQRAWATLAKDGDQISAVLELLLQSEPRRLRAHVARALGDGAAPGGQGDFLRLTRALFESFPARRARAAQLLIVASDQSSAALLHVMQRVVLKGEPEIEAPPPRLWTAPLLVLLEARDHGYLSTDPRRPSVQSVCAVAVRGANARRGLEARLRYLVGSSGRTGGKSPSPEGRFYWYFEARAVWLVCSGRLEHNSSVCVCCACRAAPCCAHCPR